MIPFNRDPQAPVTQDVVKIIGLGGAGTNILERIALNHDDSAELLLLNTDIRNLNASTPKEKIQLGPNLTKGLGTGGDPELGQNAVLESETVVRESLKGRKIVFLCTGLGGGTGSGAAPIVTRIAREEGAFVVVFATMPFSFEGRRRRDQAETALNELSVLANALVTFDNNRMGELVIAKQGVHEAFTAADKMIGESIKAVIRLVARPGIINVGLDDLVTALRSKRSRCLFGSGIATGKDRATTALRNALASPLLDQGTLLNNTQSILVHLSGGENLTLFEIELLMRQLQKYVPDKAHILFGAAIDPNMENQLSITLISALPEETLLAAPHQKEIHQPHEDHGAALDPIQGFTATNNPDTNSASEDQSILATSTPPDAFTPKSTPAENPITDAEPKPADDLITYEDHLPDTPSAPATKQPSTSPASATPAQNPASTNPPSPSLISPRKSFLPPRRDLQNIKTPTPQKQSSPSMPVDPPSPNPTPAAANPSEPHNEVEAPAPRLALNLKAEKSQSELTLDSLPRGRFQGEGPNVVDGEDLDLPPFLRKKNPQ